MRQWCAVALLTATLLLVALPISSEGQRGRGRERPPPGDVRGRQAAPEPKEAPAPGEYALGFDQILEAINRGEGPQALAYYERTAARADQDGDRTLAARAHGAAAVAALRVGLLQKAIQSGSRAIALFKDIDKEAALGPAEMREMIAAYVQVGSAYRNTGDLVKARELLEEGLRLVDARPSGRAEGLMVGALSHALARVARNGHDYPTALAHAGRAAQFFEGLLANLPARAPEARRKYLTRQAALALVEVGWAQRALGQRDEAEAVFGRALDYARRVGLRELELEVLWGQAALALTRQDWSRAVNLYQQTIALGNQIKRSSSLPWLHYGLASALSRLGRADEGLTAAREAVHGIEELRGNLGDGELRSRFLDGKQGIYGLAMALALDTQHPDEAFALAERSRARAFLDLLAGQTRLSKGRTSALIDEELRLRAQLARARAQALQSDEAESSDQGRAAAEAADRDYRAFLDRVRKESPEQASLMSVEPVTLREIQGLLPEGTTLLEYHVLNAQTVVWVVDRQQAKTLRIPIDKQALIAQVRKFRGAIASQAPTADVLAQAEAIYRPLLEAARAEIRSPRLLIVPHGVLHYLPFGALRSPAGRWLVEDFAIATLPSASVLRYLPAKGTGASGRALVVGNPDLGPALALPWAEREARMVGQLEREASLLMRADATEVEVKRLLQTVGLAHFATHGELNESDPVASALLLVPGGGEDGRLEVREIFGLDISARLVVLSGCETGLGKLSQGDELIGLQRALLYAGAPAVVTTLWKVNDRTTYELVQAFYSRLDRLGAAQALREAQLESIRTFPHPFAWAGFTLTGIPR